ncbi:DUF418 domain-containing protein [Flavobacterium piscinae]|uniref:DUF418 domain-containing protein n=1 Tax=Flavobacterium piscinae TaxID=2506424 RepID=A0A4Q1KH49_9FLAO|nr:DUF418 domain-containing protein [Flavobacterium piscinae]MBC8882416.1 DUF418 domain-containing protein [Flavobacterium piscinae]RXR28887.1 DUF418 domain-containing protein [Flavobacterium piscinae]
MITTQPTQNSERETFMDALRGFAILGIFIANLAHLSFYNESAKVISPWIMESWDGTVRFLQYLFIEGKFYSIFSLLFGWGIAFQLKRGIEKGTDTIPLIKRRLFFMLLLGGIHLLIWSGDIVFFYALLGFIILPLLKFTNKTLLIIGSTLLLSPILLYAVKMYFPILNFPAIFLFDMGDQVTHFFFGEMSNEKYRALMHEGSWLDQLKSNIAGVFYRYGYLIYVSRISKVIGMFLIGYVIGRSDFYKKLKQHRKTVITIIILGILIGIPFNYLLASYMSSSVRGEYYNLQPSGLKLTIYYALGVVPLALTYVGLLMFGFQTKLGHKILQIVSPVGRMAFTNYISHSLIGNFVFLGAGLEMMGKVGPLYLTLFGIMVFIIQIIFSTIWLRYFQYGPAEWVWRSLTYRKIQPMRLTQIAFK